MKHGNIMALPKRIQHLLKPLNFVGKFQYLHEIYHYFRDIVGSDVQITMNPSGSYNLTYGYTINGRDKWIKRYNISYKECITIILLMEYLIQADITNPRINTNVQYHLFRLS